MTPSQAEPSSVYAAQVVIGNNQAVQATSQDATNSISNANVAGRHLLGGEQKHAVKAPISLVTAWVRHCV